MARHCLGVHLDAFGETIKTQVKVTTEVVPAGANERTEPVSTRNGNPLTILRVVASIMGNAHREARRRQDDFDAINVIGTALLEMIRDLHKIVSILRWRKLKRTVRPCGVIVLSHGVAFLICDD